MADNATVENGSVLSDIQLRMRDTGSGVMASKVDVAPWVVTPKTSGQYAVSAATGADLTLTVPSGATHALISVDPTSSAVRWTRDGSSPSQTSGHYLAPGDMVELDNASALRFRGQSSAATLQVSYHSYS